MTITSQVGGLFLDSPELDRFYARVARLDVPIFVHPALVPKGYDSIQGYDLPRIIGREIDLTIATIRLIAGGVLDRHPEIDFVIGHFGGGIAAFKDRLVAMAHRFGTLKHSFEEYLDRLYFDISGFEGGITAFRCGLLGIRPERLVFATDYPQNFTGVSTGTGKGNQAIREYIEAVRSLELEEQVKEDILGRYGRKAVETGALKPLSLRGGPMKFLGLILLAVLVGAPLSGPVQAGEVVEVVLVDRLDDQRGLLPGHSRLQATGQARQGASGAQLLQLPGGRSPSIRGSTATPSRRGDSTCPASTCA